MAAKTRRDARKGRSTRRGAKRRGGGILECFGALCPSRRAKSDEFSRKGIMDYVEGLGWSVSYDPDKDFYPRAYCGSRIFHQIDGNDDNDGPFWYVPVNRCKNDKILGKNGKIVVTFETEKKRSSIDHGYIGIGNN